MMIPLRIALIAVGTALGAVSALYLTNVIAIEKKVPGAINSSKRMPDGRQWRTENLNVNIEGSYCYEDSELNCRRYGRLYTWQSAQRGCQSLGKGWRLPTNDEWRKMAKHYGGVRDDSEDGGQTAYRALVTGGSSGFNAVFGGRRSADGEYARSEAHGFYWTSSEGDSDHAWFYNFGRARYLNRHSDGQKTVALSVRCVKDSGSKAHRSWALPDVRRNLKAAELFRPGHLW